MADRPQFRKMLDAANADDAPFGEILVWKFSRFTRKREHAVAFSGKSVLDIVRTLNAEGVPTRNAGRWLRTHSRLPNPHQTLCYSWEASLPAHR